MKNENLNLIKFDTNIISLSLGKKYLYSIAEVFLKGYEDKQDVYREIDSFVNSIAYKNNVNKFILPIEVYSYLYSDSFNKLLDDYIDDEGFSYKYLFHHAKNIYKSYVHDRKQEKIYLWFKLEPTEPDKYNRLDDTLPNYDSIMCKFYLHNYRKYTSSNNTSAEGWTYQLSMFYLIVIGNLYSILRPFITNLDKFMFHCLYNLNPVIAGFRTTLRFDTVNVKALSIIHELMQLHSKGNYLQIHKNKPENSIEFCYTTLGSTFHSSLDDCKKSTYRGDNNGKRLCKLKVTGSGRTLTMRIDVVGLGVLDDLTGQAVQKSFYSLITDDVEMEVIGYRVLKYMLSHTREHGGNSSYNKVFKDLEPETKLSIAGQLMKKFNLQKLSIDYIIIAIELAKQDSTTVSNKIKTLSSKQQAKIRKIIKYVKSLEPSLPVLNNIYKIVSYKD